MKKLLALVLALVMTLSLCVTSNAAYSDAADIEHDEAVEVLSALGVINGKPNGGFDPKGTVTRAEMAKMITIIALGDVDVTAFQGTSTNLTDVNGHWAEAYIKYCYSQGVIAGKGAGLFDPNANVTSVEAAKMLLVAIGYNAKVQGYTGTDWAINVTRDAQLKGFYADLSVASNAALTRDQAAQMIYNAVDATLIEESKTLNSDGTVSTHYSDALGNKDLLKATFDVTTDKVDLNGTAYDAEKGKYTYTFSATVNGATTAKSAVDYSDLFGMKVKVMWTKDKSGATVIYGIYPDTSVVLAETVIGSLDTSDILNNKLVVGDTTYKTDVNTATMFVKDNTTADLTTKVVAGADYCSCKLIDKDGNGKVDFIVYVPTTIAKVVYVGKTNITLNGTYGGATLSVKNDTIYSGIAKDDYVVVTTGLDNNKHVEKLDTKFTSKITKIAAYTGTDANKLVAGETYKVAAPATEGITSAAIGKDMTAVAYNGYLFYTDTSSTIGVDKFAMVVNAEASTTGLGLNAHPQAVLLFTDGTKKTVDVDDTDYSGLKNTMVTFTVSDDVYTLTNATTAAGTDFDGFARTEAYTKATGKTASGYAVSDTAVIYAKNSKGWIVTTGADAKKGNNTILQAFYMTSKSTGYSSIELGVVNGVLAVTNSNYAVVTSTISTVANADNTKVAEFDIWTVDGSKTVTTTNTYDNVVTTKAIAKGSVINFTDEGENVITIDSKVAMTESAVVAYNPVANSSGEYDIAFADGTAGTPATGKIVKTTGTPATIDKDTVILYVDYDGTDYTGIEGGEIRLATETSTTNTFYTNVSYNVATGVVKVLVVEVDNNFSDVAM